MHYMSDKLPNINKTEVAPENATMQIVFLGDSALRGIVCGITRILAGSEIYGPCINPICGGMDDYPEPVGYKKMGLSFTAEFYDGKLKITFVYVKSFYDFFRVDWVLLDTIKTRPYAIVFNTGIWDYDNIARAHR